MRWGIPAGYAAASYLVSGLHNLAGWLDPLRFLSPFWHVGTAPLEDEWFYVLEGEFTVYVGEERLSLTPGSFAFGPRGVPHTFIGETDGAKALVGFQPFQFEGFLHEVGEPATERVLPPSLSAPPDMKRLLPIAERNGMVILGPPARSGTASRATVTSSASTTPAVCARAST